MDKEYLVDTNILIYYFADEIPKNELNMIEKILKRSFNISVITKIEFLGWRKHTDDGFEMARKFVGFAEVIPLTNEIANLTIDIRRSCKVKLPDAVIAATALQNDIVLVTRNKDDFENVVGLEIYNPFE